MSNSLSSIIVKSVKNVYKGFFQVDQVFFDQKRFNGEVMENVKREVFKRKPVVFLSLYDPKLDKHLLTEQVRIGAIVNTPEKPLVIEPIAGIIDEGETCFEAALREAEEETGVLEFVDVESLELVFEGYTSAGGSNEYAYFIAGIFDSSNYKEQIGGVEGEHEDIRSHLISSKEALDMISSGKLNSMASVVGVQWHLLQNK